MTTRIGPGPGWKIALAALYLGGLALLVFLAWQGRDYYVTPLIERPRHPDYWALKPGGSRGILYGILGASLMTLMLGYSLRKRWRPLRNWGALRYWLDLHILCGVLGPLFIVLHSSFKVQGLVALSFWSMVAVAASGVLGRYLYLQIPRAASGDKLTLDEVGDELERLDRELLASGSMSEEMLEELSRSLGEGLRHRRAVSLLLLLPFDNWKLHRRLNRYVDRLATPDHPVSHRWRLNAWRKIRLQRRLRLLSELQSLFHYWHVIHKPFAVVMYLFMIVHILVATATGYVPLGR